MGLRSSIAIMGSGFNVVGGFLAVIAERRDGNPTLLLQHRGVDGDVLNEDVLVAD